MLNDFEVAQQQERGPGVVGWWERVIPELDEDRRAALLEAGASPAITHRAVAKVLTNWGYPVTPAQVGHWRRNHVR